MHNGALLRIHRKNAHMTALTRTDVHTFAHLPSVQARELANAQWRQMHALVRKRTHLTHATHNGVKCTHWCANARTNQQAYAHAYKCKRTYTSNCTQMRAI